MKAGDGDLDQLSELLWNGGIAGFCPTTLSTHPGDLAQAVGRIGRWIKNFSPKKRGALPLGIHLEGPFINEACCGAHPPELIRPLNFQELENLWYQSHETLRILTIAPETLSRESLHELTQWAKKRKISLSLGHSKASEKQAETAFDAGFRGITHAWNALPFHQRAPGPIGAAMKRDDTYIELIIDQVHVAPTVMKWTQDLHPAERLCMISDCVPAAETSGSQDYSFGPLTIRYHEGACRLHNGSLAGGGKLLTRSFGQWLEFLAKKPGDFKTLLKESLPSITTAPLWAIQIPEQRLASRKVDWCMSQGKLVAQPVDSSTFKR